jgi:hypothetical protein
MNERCTCALLATEEMVISDPSACISASAWWTRCRRRSTWRRRARASGVSPVVMGRSSGAGGQADAGHAEVDELAGLADHGDRVVDQARSCTVSSSRSASMRRINSRNWVISSSRG